MSMFRRPTDDSSDSDSSSEESLNRHLDLSNASTENFNGTEEVVGADLTTTATLSSGESISVDHSNDETALTDVDNVRNMMLASLLEDFYRTRAAELFNSTHPGAHYDRQSPEIQPLAKAMFAQASRTLSTNGILPSLAASNDVRNTRSQYLTGLDNLGLQNLNDNEMLMGAVKKRISESAGSLAMVRANSSGLLPHVNSANHPARELALRTERMSLVPHPASDMRITSIPQARSHYQSSFQEMSLLGRGGFGRVYKTFNVFDKREYAVKKIPLSVKLSQQYRERGHTELTSILREVQALAQLDHCNVVRYHATWIEDPTTPVVVPTPPSFQSPFGRRKLIAERPLLAPATEIFDRRQSSSRFIEQDETDGIMFEADSVDFGKDQNIHLGWSHHSKILERESSAADSDIFTDGAARGAQPRTITDDPTCYVLHVQMSMYPMTLAQYVSPGQHSTRDAPSLPVRKHCFHLLPAVKILLGIICGLQYIHARGLVHRDIKPSNIFLSHWDTSNFVHLPDGYHDVGKCPACPSPRSYHLNPRIGDFGLVAELAREGGSLANLGSSGDAVGTEYYRPPAGKGKNTQRVVDEKLDVYALGVVFVEMLWRCGTSMERMNLLKSTQKGVVPQEIFVAVEAEGHPSGTAKMVEDVITGMIHQDHSMRWTCLQAKEQLEKIVARCMSSI